MAKRARQVRSKRQRPPVKVTPAMLRAMEYREEANHQSSKDLGDELTQLRFVSALTERRIEDLMVRLRQERADLKTTQERLLIVSEIILNR